MMTILEYEATKIKIERENEEKLKRYPILEKQLKIAVEALEFFASVYDWNTPLNENDVENVAEDYLKQIKELKQTE